MKVSNSGQAGLRDFICLAAVEHVTQLFRTWNTLSRRPSSSL